MIWGVHSFNSASGAKEGRAVPDVVLFVTGVKENVMQVRAGGVGE